MIKFFESINKFIANLKLKISKFSSKTFSKHPYIFLFLIIIFIIVSLNYNNVHSASIYFGLLIILSAFNLFFRKELKKDNFSELDTYERVIRLAGVMSLLFLAITYLVLTFARFVIPDVLHFGSVDSWIQFAGSILGGTLTLFALAITLFEQNKIRDEDKKNELLPFLNAEVECYLNNRGPVKDYLYMSGNWKLKVSNISRNPARNVKITQYKVRFYDLNNETFFEELDLSITSKLCLSTSLISSSQMHDVIFNLNKSKLPKQYFNGLKFYFEIEYYDITLKNKHLHSSTHFFRDNQTKLKYDEKGYTDWIFDGYSNDFIE